MAGKHPYISSGGPLVQAITQFRKSFPGTVDASTLKKLGIASNNESYLINIFRFLQLIDDDEQKGYQFIFAGVMSAIRNPKGHEYSIEDDLDTCLDHLTLISSLFRRLEEAGLVIAP